MHAGRPGEPIEALEFGVQEDIEKSSHRQTGKILLDPDVMSRNQIGKAVKSIFQHQGKGGVQYLALFLLS